MQKGLTLIEIVVVIAIFGVLVVATTGFLVGVVQNANYTTMQNEVRQNAEKLLADMTMEIRRSGCVYFQSVGGQIYVDLSDNSGLNNYCNCTQGGANCSPANAGLGSYHVSYNVSSTGVVTKTIYQFNPSSNQTNQVISSTVASCQVVSCGTSQCFSGTNGGVGVSIADPSAPNLSAVGGILTNRAVVVQVQVRQAQTTATRYDSCAQISLEDTVTPRNL